MTKKAFVRMTTKQRIRAIGAYRHNNRLIKDDKNVFSEFTKNNIKIDFVNGKTYRQIELEFEKLYKEKHKRKAHKQSMPLRELVLLTAEHSTIDDIKKFCKEVEKLTGFKTIDINWHRDEGHYENGEFIENQHCHIMLEAFDRETGKTIRPPKGTTEKLQDIASLVMNMRRGTSKKLTKKVHLTPEQYKQVQVDKNRAIKNAVNENADILHKIIDKKDNLIRDLNETNKQNELANTNNIKNTQKLAKSYEVLKNMIETLEQENEALKTANNLLITQVCELENTSTQLKSEKLEFANYFEKTINEISVLQELLDLLGLGEIKQKIKEIKQNSKNNYMDLRATLKNSGIATQQDYQLLKIEYDKVSASVKLLESTSKQNKNTKSNVTLIIK